jgi:hypothetical protein
MTNAGRSMRESRSGGEDEGVLRAKYLDFCSARVAEALLSLTPDEMYLLAEEAARDARVPHEVPFGYDDIVRLATERISRRLDLPSFEAFVEAYRQNPDTFDREMLGLWQSDTPPAAPQGPGGAPQAPGGSGKG